MTKNRVFQFVLVLLWTSFGDKTTFKVGLVFHKIESVSANGFQS